MASLIDTFNKFKQKVASINVFAPKKFVSPVPLVTPERSLLQKFAVSPAAKPIEQAQRFVQNKVQKPISNYLTKSNLESQREIKQIGMPISFGKAESLAGQFLTKTPVGKQISQSSLPLPFTDKRLPLGNFLKTLFAEDPQAVQLTNKVRQGETLSTEERKYLKKKNLENVMAFVGDVAIGDVKAGKIKSIFEVEDARKIANLFKKNTTGGQLSIEDTDEVLRMVKHYLKIPKEFQARMSADEMLGDLQSLLTPNERYAFIDLDKANKLNQSFKTSSNTQFLKDDVGKFAGSKPGLKIPKAGSGEQIIEQAGGWKPGMKAQFDMAMAINKDPDEVRRLLPEVPAYYKEKFATEINNLLGEPTGGVSSTKLGSTQALPSSGNQIPGPGKPLAQATQEIGMVGGVDKSQAGFIKPDEFINETQTRLDQLYTKSIDRFHPLSKVAKEAGEDQAMRNALTQYYGTGSTANFETQFKLSPILKEQPIDDLRKVAIAARDAELKGRGIQGSNVDYSLDSLKKTLGEDKVSAVQETLKKLYKYQDDIVKKYLVDTEVISKSGYEQMRKSNEFYVPFKRVMDEVDEHLGVVPQTKGAGSVSGQDVVFKIKGSKREIIDPIESVIESTYKAVSLGRRQQVAKTLISLKDKLPDGLITKIDKVGNTPSIAVFENGKVQHYAVPPEIAEAAKGLNEESLNLIVKALAVPTKLFRATATGINPEFFGPNVLRDVQSAYVNVGLNPLRWVKGLAHLVKQDDLYQKFLESGGKTSRISIDRPILTQTVSELSGNAPTISKPSDLLKILQTAGEYSEQPTRIAVFEQQYLKGLKQNLPESEAMVRAANAAQEATVNFARRGSQTQAVNSLYAFMNARVQGVDRLIRSFKGDPAGVGFRLALITQAPAIATYLWNRSFESYNDPRIVSDTDKQNNFIVMVSDKPVPQLGGSQFIKIPKGDVGKLANPTEEFLSYLDGKGGEIRKSLMTTLKAFSPIDDTGGIIPTALRPPVEAAANKNFFTGFEIVPKYKTSYPPGLQSSSYTAPMYRMIGEKLNISPAKIQHIIEGYSTGIGKISEQLIRPFIPKDFKTPENEQGATINRSPIVRRFLGGAKRTEEEEIMRTNNGKTWGEKLLKMTPEEKVKTLKQIKELNPDLLKDITKELKIKNLGLTPPEDELRKITAIKDRARAVNKYLKSIPAEQQADAIRRLKEARVLTPDTMKELVNQLKGL